MASQPLTINDIAKLANVSKRTVSRVLNNSPSTKSETRDRIMNIIQEVGYVPDPQARGLAFPRAKPCKACDCGRPSSDCRHHSDPKCWL